MPNVVTYQQLWTPIDIGTTETTIYTSSPTSSTGVTKNISAVICNTTSSAITVEVWVRESAGGTAHKLINSEIIPANSRLPFTVPDMADGNVLTAAGSATGLTIHPTSGIVIN